MDKLTRAKLFRRRLALALERTATSRSALARACGVDRSTVSQLLADGDGRLPNAHIAAECAGALGVSVDWLLGLSERSERAAELLAASVQMADAARAPADDQILQWHREAAGLKIRHVPATLPDILKTNAVLAFEYAAFLDRTPEQAAGAMRAKLEWMRSPGSDYEICVPVDVVTSLARGEGYWRGLAKADREEQIRHMARLCRRFYPSLRLYLYDEKRIYSAPVTIFGTLLAAVYVGRFYMVFRSADRVHALTDHFDSLVREADIEARRVADRLDTLDIAG